MDADDQLHVVLGATGGAGGALVRELASRGHRVRAVSRKPAEVRMGSGKGSPELWVARVKPGRIMFELDGVAEATAREALELGAAKLPIKTRIVKRQA